MDKQPGVLDEFFEFARDCWRLLSWTKKLAIALPPIIAYIAPYSPPWPSSGAIVGLTAVSELVVVAVAFEFWKASAIGRTRWVLGLCAPLMFVSILYYQGLWSDYIVVFPDAQDDPIVIGYTLQPHLQELRDSDPVRYSDANLLNSWERMPEKVWTRESLRENRLKFIIAWLVFWMSLFAFIASFVAIQTRRASRRRGRTKSAEPKG